MLESAHIEFLRVSTSVNVQLGACLVSWEARVGAHHETITTNKTQSRGGSERHYQPKSVTRGPCLARSYQTAAAEDLNGERLTPTPGGDRDPALGDKNPLLTSGKWAGANVAQGLVTVGKPSSRTITIRGFRQRDDTADRP